MGFLTEVSGPPVTDTPSARWIFERIEEWAARSPDRLAFAVDHQDTQDLFHSILHDLQGATLRCHYSGVLKIPGESHESPYKVDRGAYFRF